MEKILQLQDLQPGSSYLVRARATNKYGVVSEWSETFKLNVTTDDSPPSTPAAPTIQLAGPQKIVVSHDNTKNGGGDLEYDVVSYKVYQNTTNANSGGTLIQTMSATRPGSGLDSFATINVDVKETDPSVTRYFYVTAVDAAGNESQPSPTATGVDITFFESAYISDLTADKIRTGTLQANQQIGVGTVSPIILKSNEASPRGQIYIGGGNYANVDTAFYVDSTGKFSLKNALTWDGDTLSINGYLQVGEALETGDAADDVNNNITTISGNKIRTGNLISNNYLRIDPATDTGGLDGIPNNGDPDTQPTGTGDELYTYSGTWFDLDDGSIWAKNFYIDTSGNARFRGNLFASKARFSGEQEDPLDLENEDGVRIPTVSIESTDSDDGYLVFFRDIGRDAGLEFYTKQNDGSSWRRGSLAHLSDPEGTAAGGFLRLGAFRSKTDNTPGRIRIFAEPSISGEQSEIYLDARRTYAQKLFLTQPSTLGDWLNDPVTNFWKDPDGVSNGQDYFKVGSTLGSAIVVKKKADGTDKVVIKDYEIEGVGVILDDSKITVNTVEIGKGVGGSGKHGIKIDGSNYWYDPAPLGSTDIVFRAGGSANKALTVRKDGSVEFEGTTNPTDGEIKGKLIIKNVSDLLTFEIGKNVVGVRDGIKLNDNNYWTISQTSRTADFRVGGNSKYLFYDPSTDTLNISGNLVAATGSFSGSLNAATGSFSGNISGSTIISQDSASYAKLQSGELSFYIKKGTYQDWQVNEGDDDLIGSISAQIVQPRSGSGVATGYLVFDAQRMYVNYIDTDVIYANGIDLGTTSYVIGLGNIDSNETVDKVLGRITGASNETKYLRWIDPSDLGGGGATYTSGDEDLGIIVDNTNNTITNAGFRKVGNTLGWQNTRGNTENRITYGSSIPGNGTGRSDGDIHIEF